ncbi:MAG: type II toxin-antitoxin system Phd/YefM family antitoxin [Alphaproteobacteria bacterium]|nr:type II toxin-antitoxin system Phd/YefM family antitoxin [Alphaproteobacteria bacterium]
MPSTAPNWSLFDAKARFSEVVERARHDGPQFVTKRGEPAVVILSAEDYAALRPPLQAGRTFKDVLVGGPKLDEDVIDLINARSRDFGREIDL